MLIGRPSTRRHTSSATRTASARVAPVTTMQNSSPPIRAARLPGTSPLAWLTAWPTDAIRRSPASWPNESLTCLSRLMSASTTETGKVPSLPGAISASSRSSTARRLASPVSGSWNASRSIRAKWSACTTPAATWVATAAANSRSAGPNLGWPARRVAYSAPHTRASTMIGTPRQQSLPSDSSRAASASSSSRVAT